MSINLSQIFVRYPDEKDAASLLATWQARDPSTPSYLVTRTGGPWLAVCAGNNEPSLDAARLLSRALEATVAWFGLAGSELAYRFVRLDLGREKEAILEPPEISPGNESKVMPAYRDVEAELHARLRTLGLPAEYRYLFFEEVGVSGGPSDPPDAAVIRKGVAEPFRHRVPKRNTDAVRTYFDLFKEGEEAVYETLRLRGAFEPSRGRQLLHTLEQVCRRRSLPPGWKTRYVLDPGADSDLLRQLEQLHSRGTFSFELARRES